MDAYTLRVQDFSHIEFLSKLKNLSFCSESSINNEQLRKMTQLTSIVIVDNINIGYEGVKYLTNLTKLRVNEYITNEGIKNLTNLTKLYINKHITNDEVCKLPKLRKIYAQYDSFEITDNYLRKSHPDIWIRTI